MSQLAIVNLPSKGIQGIARGASAYDCQKAPHAPSATTDGLWWVSPETVSQVWDPWWVWHLTASIVLIGHAYLASHRGVLISHPHRLASVVHFIVHFI